MHAAGDVPSALLYGIGADRVTNAEIDGANFQRKGMDANLFLRECTRAGIQIYVENATLEDSAIKAISDNPELLDLVNNLKKTCDANTCVDYGNLLERACQTGQRWGMGVLVA